MLVSSSATALPCVIMESLDLNFNPCAEFLAWSQPPLSLQTCLVTTRPDLNSDLWVGFPTWSQTCPLTMLHPHDPDASLALNILPWVYPAHLLGPVGQCLLALGFSPGYLPKLLWFISSALVSIDHIRMKEFFIGFQEALRDKGLPCTLAGTLSGIPE